jgi:hypothetical protein
MSDNYLLMPNKTRTVVLQHAVSNLASLLKEHYPQNFGITYEEAQDTLDWLVTSIERHKELKARLADPVYQEREAEMDAELTARFDNDCCGCCGQKLPNTPSREIYLTR